MFFSCDYRVEGVVQHDANKNTQAYDVVLEKGLEATKKALSDAKTPEMKKAQEASCKAGLDALKGNPSCK